MWPFITQIYSYKIFTLLLVNILKLASVLWLIRTWREYEKWLAGLANFSNYPCWNFTSKCLTWLLKADWCICLYNNFFQIFLYLCFTSLMLHRLTIYQHTLANISPFYQLRNQSKKVTFHLYKINTKNVIICILFTWQFYSPKVPEEYYWYIYCWQFWSITTHFWHCMMPYTLMLVINSWAPKDNLLNDYKT